MSFPLIAEVAQKPCRNNNGYIRGIPVFNTTVDMGGDEFGSTLSNDDFGLTENDVKIYPNPTTSVLNIKMKTVLKQATIYSVLGAKVLQTLFAVINTSALNRGMYVIEIQYGKGQVS